jgi:hypothetical protein
MDYIVSKDKDFLIIFEFSVIIKSAVRPVSISSFGLIGEKAHGSIFQLKGEVIKDLIGSLPS